MKHEPTRHIVRMILETMCPLHIGTGEDGCEFDAPVARDVFGHWVLPATSIAGLLRERCRSTLGTDVCNAVFGYQSGDRGHASPLTISDGHLLDFDGRSCLHKVLEGRQPALDVSTMRCTADHVRLQTWLENDLDKHGVGTASNSGKFDIDFVPAGVRFVVEFQYDDYADKWETVAGLLLDLAAGHMAIGGNTGRGYGRVKAACIPAHLKLDLNCSKDITAFGKLPADPAGSMNNEDQLLDTHRAAVSTNTDGIHGSVTMTFETTGPLLIGGAESPIEDASETAPADMVCLTQPVLDWGAKRFVAKPVVPGSAVRGLLRSRVITAMTATGMDRADIKAAVANLFGTAEDSARRGRIDVHGCVLEDTATQRLAHVAIDRLTGGALRGALFTEEPIWVDDLQIPIQITLRGVSEEDLFWLVHAVLDIHDGIAPLGGGTRRGNGTLRIAKKKGSDFGGFAVEAKIASFGQHESEDALKSSVMNHNVCKEVLA